MPQMDSIPPQPNGATLPAASWSPRPLDSLHHNSSLYQRAVRRTKHRDGASAVQTKGPDFLVRLVIGAATALKPNFSKKLEKLTKHWASWSGLWPTTNNLSLLWIHKETPLSRMKPKNEILETWSSHFSGLAKRLLSRRCWRTVLTWCTCSWWDLEKINI